MEVWLTSEDTGAYGRDIGASLPMLLRRILPLMPPGTRLKVGMTNPPYILEHLEEMAELFSHPRLYKFLHVPGLYARLPGAIRLGARRRRRRST